MDQEQTQIPIDQLFTELLEGDPLPIHHLFRLSDMNRDEFATFVERFSAAGDERRQAIIRHMADISEEDFMTDFSPIFSTYLDDAFAPVRLAALDGLWDADDPTLIPRIVALLETDPDDGVRRGAAAALSHFVLLSEWEEISETAAAPIVPALLAAYDDSDSSLGVRRAALESLGAATHPRVPELIEQAYDSGDADLRLSAVFAMGNSADSRWLRHVLDEMESPVIEMRAEAARSAGSIGSSDAVDQLRELAYDEEPDVAFTAVTSLGRIGGDNVVAFLAALLEDDAFAELHDAIDEAIQEATMMNGMFDMLAFMPNGLDEEDDDDELILTD